jgi:hypothetical protein
VAKEGHVKLFQKWQYASTVVKVRVSEPNGRNSETQSADSLKDLLSISARVDYYCIS